MLKVSGPSCILEKLSLMYGHLKVRKARGDFIFFFTVGWAGNKRVRQFYMEKKEARETADRLSLYLLDQAL